MSATGGTGGAGEAGGGVSRNSEASTAASVAGNTAANVETGSGAAPEVVSTTTTAVVASPDELIARLTEIHDRVMPILEVIRREYAPRVPGSYPTLIDNIERGGIFGINFAPGFGAYFMTDGQRLFAELHNVSLRTDTLSAANGEKFGGEPNIIQREIDDTWTDLQFRNFVSELLSKWNFQQTRIFRVDS
jgi:hypothetical protein